MKAKILGLLAAGLMFGLMQQASAVALAPGQSILWAWNLGAAPAQEVALRLEFVTSSDLFSAGLYSDPAGTTQVGFFVPSSGSYSYNVGFGGIPGISDGIFSVRFTANTSMTADVCALYRNSTAGCVQGAQVPEPGTLALLGLGLAGLGLSGRRKAA